MNIVLLSGGSGKRLWPLSNDVRSKQFIKIFKKENGDYESMVQRVYRQIMSVDKDAVITIATAKAQVSAIRNQLGDGVGICVEPCRRDTFPAIALAASYLHDVKGVSEDETIVVCPVDPYVEQDYFEAIKELAELASKDVAKLMLLGMEPTYPSEKYGYIIPQDTEKISKVQNFKEKPSAEMAEEYISQGALWNGGVFALKIKYVLKRAHELIDFVDYYDLYEKYHALTKISFDYAVVEGETDIAVMRYNGQWKDLGTWDVLVDAMVDDTIGNAILSETCENVHVVNELDLPIFCMGLKDVVVAASPDGILVSDVEDSYYIRPYVQQMKNQIMVADKSWGSYRVLDVAKESMTVAITLDPGNQMNYHSHEHRDEVWTIISGKGYTIVDGMKQNVSAGDVITMAAGCRHTVVAETVLNIIEVHLGKGITADDKRKFELE